MKKTEEHFEKIDKAIYTIIEELVDAELKHPFFPDDPVHGAAIMAEESGEAVQAAIDLYYGPVAEAEGNKAKLRKELAQTAAMCIRNMIYHAEEE